MGGRDSRSSGVGGDTGEVYGEQQDLDPEIGTGDFTEGTSVTDVQNYTWDDPGLTLRKRGFAPAGSCPGTTISGLS